MIIIPNDVSWNLKQLKMVENSPSLFNSQVRCTFCDKIFCCSKCRGAHECKVHDQELNDKKKENYLMSLCLICNGQNFPFNINIQPSIDMMNHIATYHLPLRCNKCSHIFENLSDIQSYGKCCIMETVTASEQCEDDKIESENMGESVMQEPVKNDLDLSIPSDENEQAHEDGVDENLTPLTKINMRWRRKSKNFELEPTSQQQQFEIETKTSKKVTLVRQTSTPMLNNLLTNNNFTDSTYNASSIQISSINCTSTSSESDGYSPPVSCPKAQIIPPSPKSFKKVQLQNRSRPTKMPVRATPLRQVMSKSIQRAIAQHGHYRQIHFGLNQRKMSFNSTGSSNEYTTSLVKFLPDSGSPLDLRTSPALRRSDSMSPKRSQIQDKSGNACSKPSSPQIKYEQIEIIVRRAEIQSDSGMTSYRSCFTGSERSESMPLLECTPKITGINFNKKTISFETPTNVMQSPNDLPIMDDDDTADEVFYTPQTTPMRKPLTLNSYDRKLNLMHTIVDISDETTDELTMEPKKTNIWNLVSSVMNIATGKSNESKTTSDNVWSFNFRKPSFVQRATDYFVRYLETDPDDQRIKRRRTSSTTERRPSSCSSPVCKRQKIQARRPIERMRRLS